MIIGLSNVWFDSLTSIKRSGQAQEWARGSAQRSLDLVQDKATRDACAAVLNGEQAKNRLDVALYEQRKNYMQHSQPQRARLALQYETEAAIARLCIGVAAWPGDEVIYHAAHIILLIMARAWEAQGNN